MIKKWATAFSKDNNTGGNGELYPDKSRLGEAQGARGEALLVKEGFPGKEAVGTGAVARLHKRILE